RRSPPRSAATRPPPRATLFPYTTLFRSFGGIIQGLHPFHQGAVGAVQHLAQAAAQLGGAVQHIVQVVPGLIGKGIHMAPEAVQGDRKSTRLNSSHVSISYAVFCLTKKKT